LRALSRLLDRVVDACAWVAGALLLFQVASVSIDVLMRYLFDMPIRAVISLNEWSLLFIAFLGAAWLQRQGGHVRMDILIDRFGPRFAAVLDLFGMVLGIAVCVALVWFGTAVTWEKYTTGVYDYFKLREVPIYVVYVVIPVGSLLFLLQLGRDLYRKLAGLSQARRDAEEKTVTGL